MIPMPPIASLIVTVGYMNSDGYTFGEIIGYLLLALLLLISIFLPIFFRR